MHFEFAQYITKLVERCDFLQELGLAADIALSRAFDAARRTRRTWVPVTCARARAHGGSEALSSSRLSR